MQTAATASLSIANSIQVLIGFCALSVFLIQNLYLLQWPSKHDILNQCWFNAGPLSGPLTVWVPSLDLRRELTETYMMILN